MKQHTTMYMFDNLETKIETKYLMNQEQSQLIISFHCFPSSNVPSTTLPPKVTLYFALPPLTIPLPFLSWRVNMKQESLLKHLGPIFLVGQTVFLFGLIAIGLLVTFFQRLFSNTSRDHLFLCFLESGSPVISTIMFNSFGSAQTGGSTSSLDAQV